MSNLLDSIICPRCGARGRLRQYLVVTVCRSAVVTWLAKHGVEEIDVDSIEYSPVDGAELEEFACAECGHELGGFRDLIRQVAPE